MTTLPKEQSFRQASKEALELIFVPFSNIKLTEKLDAEGRFESSEKRKWDYRISTFLDFTKLAGYLSFGYLTYSALAK